LTSNATTIIRGVKDNSSEDKNTLITYIGTNSTSDLIKPTQSKVTITGCPASIEPRLVNYKCNQLWELCFRNEMVESLPKGLPNLGATSVRVLLTPKQWERLQPELNPTTRLYVEGEPAVSIDACDMTAFMKVVCTRITTLAAEQAKKEALTHGLDYIGNATNLSLNHVLAQTPKLSPSRHPQLINIAQARPTRTTMALSGNLTPLSDNPRVINRGRDQQLIELVFDNQMSNKLPKGLPNLGNTQVVVWVTGKQWRTFQKNSQSLGINSDIANHSRIIIEGEVATSVTKNLEPFLRLLCVRLSSPELEKARRELLQMLAIS
jgi:hypothetical protein